MTDVPFHARPLLIAQPPRVGAHCAPAASCSSFLLSCLQQCLDSGCLVTMKLLSVALHRTHQRNQEGLKRGSFILSRSQQLLMVTDLLRSSVLQGSKRRPADADPQERTILSSHDRGHTVPAAGSPCSLVPAQPQAAGPDCCTSRRTGRLQASSLCSCPLREYYISSA